MRIRFLLLACLLLFCFLPPDYSPVSAQGVQGDDAAQILARINALRQQNGLPPLDLSGVLTASAQRHSNDMASTGNVDHTKSYGATPSARAGASRWFCE